ncbi:MAG: cation:proton antiporter [Planctomycetota bacterium]
MIDTLLATDAAAPASLFNFYPAPTLAAGALTPGQITVFLLSLAVLLGLARLLGEIARRFGQPAVLGEILAGVILGQTVFYQVAPEAFDWLFPQYETAHTVIDANVAGSLGSEANLADVVDAVESGDAAIESEKPYSPVYISLLMLMNLSVAFLLLVAGLEVDLSVVWRQGKAAAAVSITGMVIPFALGFGGAYLLPTQMGYDVESDALLTFALFVGIAMSITALPVIAKILMDLNMFKSDMGMLIMSSAMVNDLLGWIGFAVVLAMITAAPEIGLGAEEAASGGAGSGLGMTIGLTLLFVAGMLTAGRWAANKILPFIIAHASWPGGVLGFVLVMALLCGAATEAIGIHSIFGAFLAGVAIGDSKHLRAQTRETIEQFITNIFAPIFFAGVGLRVNFIEGFDFVAVLLVLGIAIAGKVFGCYFGAKLAGLSKRESWAVGFGMSARGAMEIILGQLALEAGLINETLFVAIVVMAIATSLFAGPGMQFALGQKSKRKLADFLDADAFKVLDCATRRDAIRQLSTLAAEHLGRSPEIVDAAVWQREQLMSTGLGQAIAVPHARLTDLKEPLVAIGLSPAGIDFDAADGQLAEIVCLILTPDDQPETQIELLDIVARTLGKDEVRREAVGAGNYTEFLAALSVAQAKQSEH